MHRPRSRISVRQMRFTSPQTSGWSASAVSNQTWEELSHAIRKLVSSSADLDALLSGMVVALTHHWQSSAVIIWGCSEDTLRPVQAHPQEVLQHPLLTKESHSEVLLAALRRNVVVVATPGWQRSPAQQPPLDAAYCIACPVKLFQSESFVIEVMHSVTGQEAENQQIARMLKASCDLLRELTTQKEVMALREAAMRLRQYCDFATRANETLDLRRTARIVSGELCHLLEASRVSLVVHEHGRARVAGISGVEYVHHHASLVRSMAALVERTLKCDEPIHFTEGETSLRPPQLDTCLYDFLEYSPARTLLVVPLHSATRDENREQPRIAVGAVVVEYFNQVETIVALRKKLDLFLPLVTTAVHNSVKHQGIAFLPLWEFAQRLRRQRSGWLVSKHACLLWGLISLGSILVMMPGELTVPASGTIRPCVQRDLFAGASGVVTEVFVQHGDKIKQGDLLARIKDAELELKLTEVRGRRDVAVQEMRALEHLILQQGSVDDTYDQVGAKLAQQRASVRGLDLQLQVLQEKQARCEIRSGIDGTLVTWKPKEELVGRPVQIGERLLTVASMEQGLELLLSIDERHAGHIISGGRATVSSLSVDYYLITSPAEQGRAWLRDIELRTQSDPSEQQIVLARAIPVQQMKGFIDGASVSAKIHCGTCSLGYAWLHDIWDYVDGHIRFWF